MSFDLLDDIMIDVDFDREYSFGDLILDEGNEPIATSCELGAKRERSQASIAHYITEESEDCISDDDRDELNEFLEGIGFLENTTAVSEAPVVGPIATQERYNLPPSSKRRRVTNEIPAKQCKSNKTRRAHRQCISLEEMQRLMSTYGPIKSPRKRKCKDENGAAVKEDSIKRKFYRWFPDLEERFFLDGITYKPLAGHDEEVAYREHMRNVDREALVDKRKAGKKN